jgi:tetratricopeptide (TPR) repeat protein
VATKRQLAWFSLEMGDVVGAIRILRQIEEQNPDLLQVKMGLSRIYAELGDPDVALAYMREAWEIRPDRVHDDLALLYYQLGDRESAQRHWQDYRDYIATSGSGEDRLADVDRTAAVISQDWPKASELLEARLEELRRETDPWRQLMTAARLAGVEARLGRDERAIALMREARPSARTTPSG